MADSLGALLVQNLADPELSEFEREVFERAVENGEISAADYQEAFARYDSCVTALGYDETSVLGRTVRMTSSPFNQN